MDKPTVILGASPQPERYAYLAYRTLVDQKRPFILVNPRYTEIEGNMVVSDLGAVREAVGTVSVYLSPEKQSGLAEALRELRPQRVIFNPGAENPALKQDLEIAGVPCLEACTLVLLRTGQF